MFKIVIKLKYHWGLASYTRLLKNREKCEEKNSEIFAWEIYESGKLCPRNLPVWNSLSKKSTSHFSESLWLQIFYLKIIINPTFYKILLNFSRTPLSCTEVGGGLKVHIFKQVQRIERFIFLFWGFTPVIRDIRYSMNSTESWTYLKYWKMSARPDGCGQI